MCNEYYKKLILDVAKEKFPHIRKRTYNLNYYLNLFCLLNNDVVKWESLKITKIYKPKKEILGESKDYHYGTVKNFFNKWCEKEVFIEAHNRFLKKYYFELKPHLKKLGINLYIDTTTIWNKYGVECVGVHPEYRKKNGTKIATLTDADGDIISIINMMLNFTTGNLNGHEFIKKTFNHDVTIIQDLFDNIIVHLDGRKNINLCGDGAFKTNNTITHNNKTVNITTPKRNRTKKQTKKMTLNLKNKIKIIDFILKNLKETNKIGKKYLNYVCKKNALEDKIEQLNIKQQTNYTKQESEILNKRYIVENNYCALKKSERVAIRKDHKIKNFMSFVIIAELQRITKKYNEAIIEINNKIILRHCN